MRIGGEGAGGGGVGKGGRGEGGGGEEEDGGEGGGGGRAPNSINSQSFWFIFKQFILRQLRIRYTGTVCWQASAVEN